jgi:hypothetical protein
MRAVKRFAVLLLAPAIPAFVLAASAAPSVVGNWFGQGQPDDKTAMYLDHLLPNGDFHGEYRNCVKGKTVDTTQSGRWMLKGDRLTIIIGNDDGMPTLRTDLYTMLSLEDRLWKYRFDPTAFLYSAKRVDGGFKLPPCQLVS